MLRRVFLSCSGIGVATLLCGGCFLKASVPKGWRRISLSNVAFNVPQNWKQVEFQIAPTSLDGTGQCRTLRRMMTVPLLVAC